MASFKCPDCGASLTDDSRFCKYCGAKIDDGVKRVEVKIDKRIEDIAEIKRAEREEKEFIRREKKEKAQTIGKWIRRGVLSALFLAGLGMATLVKKNGDVVLTGIIIVFCVSTYTVLTWIHNITK